MPLENLFPCFLTILLASIVRVIPTHLFRFLIFSLFAFYSICKSNRLPCTKTLLNCFNRRMLTTALTWQNTSLVNIVDILPAPVTEIFLLFYHHANPIRVKQCLESQYQVSGQGRCPGWSLGEGLPGLLRPSW